MRDAKIAGELRKRSVSAYENLITAYGRLLWTVAAGILTGVGTREDVEEVVNDVFTALWQSPERYDPQKGSLKNYLCLMTRTRAVDRLRSLCRRPVLPLEEQPEPEGEDLQEWLEREETIRLLWELLEQLPEPDGAILRLRLVYELKPADIAAKLELPVPEVYEIIRRGKRRLAAALRKEGYDA